MQADIQQMVRDAEEHASEDKKRRDLIEARNSADSAIYGYASAVVGCTHTFGCLWE